MEASALPSRLARTRAPLSAAFLRLRSDEQLVALFRAGSDDAFRAIHDRYRTRLLAYARQMLRGGSGDPEDALQDVFLRAYRALRGSDRPVILRAWLYRIAHNRCIDELRRPSPVPSELDGDAEPAFSGPRASGEPSAVVERGAALTRLLADVQTLPSQQRSALLMRELQGLSYEELGSALGVSVPAVKSLLLRARTGLIDLASARDTPCGEIRDELIGAADRSVRISGRARRHCAECSSCDTYRGELKRVRRGFAALTPTGPLGQLGVLFGLGGGGGAAAAGGGGGGRRRRRVRRRDRGEDRRRGLLRGADRHRRAGRARAAIRPAGTRARAAAATLAQRRRAARRAPRRRHHAAALGRRGASPARHRPPTWPRREHGHRGGRRARPGPSGASGVPLDRSDGARGPARPARRGDRRGGHRERGDGRERREPAPPRERRDRRPGDRRPRARRHQRAAQRRDGRGAPAHRRRPARLGHRRLATIASGRGATGTGTTAPTSRRRRLAGRTAVARAAPGGYALGQPSLVRELVEVGRERGGRARPQLRRHLRPDAVEQLVALAQPVRERLEQPPLAIEAVPDVLIELGGGVGDQRPVARARSARGRARAAAAAPAR